MVSLFLSTADDDFYVDFSAIVTIGLAHFPTAYGKPGKKNPPDSNEGICVERIADLL